MSKDRDRKVNRLNSLLSTEKTEEQGHFFSVVSSTLKTPFTSILCGLVMSTCVDTIRGQ